MASVKSRTPAKLPAIGAKVGPETGGMDDDDDLGWDLRLPRTSFDSEAGKTGFETFLKRCPWWKKLNEDSRGFQLFFALEN